MQPRREPSVAKDDDLTKTPELPEGNQAYEIGSQNSK